MPSPQLPHHLRAHRKRLALSQDEVAFLLGNQAGTQVSRYENFERVPPLETALAYEVIMKRSTSELFGGLYREAEKRVAERANILMKNLGERSDAASAGKRSTLAELAGIEK